MDRVFESCGDESCHMTISKDGDFINFESSDYIGSVSLDFTIKETKELIKHLQTLVEEEKG